MKITIDQNSGYCFGVEFAIQMAEDEIGETKDQEALLLQEQSHLKMELAKLTGKKNLTDLASKAISESDRIESLASY